MRICVVQTRPVRGDVDANVRRHRELAEAALGRGAELIVFPELSLTGYEPELAAALALDADDPRLAPLQQLSDASGTILGVGAPTKSPDGVRISLILLRPGQAPAVHSKMHLHADEAPYFVAGPQAAGILEAAERVALAICYELSVPEHAERAVANGATVYLASVAKTAGGVERASGRLAQIARESGLLVLMANAVGPSGDGLCSGQSSAWNRRGEVVAQLGAQCEGILILDSVESSAEVCEL